MWEAFQQRLRVAVGLIACRPERGEHFLLQAAEAGGRGWLPGWAWAAAAAAVYHGSKCISSSLCLLHAGLGLRLVLGLGRMLGRLPLAPATVPSLSPALALAMGLTLCWLSLHLSPSVGTKPMVRQARQVQAHWVYWHAPADLSCNLQS